MKKTYLTLVLLYALQIHAQEGHLQIKADGPLNFIPSGLTLDKRSKLHIMQENGINIYDDDLTLEKCVKITPLSFEYLSSQHKSREVEGVERITLQRGEELTSYYTSICENFKSLTFEEKIGQIIISEKELYNTEAIVTKEENHALISTPFQDTDFFGYVHYGYQYPLNGILIEKEGGVYKFTAKYEYIYSQWGEYIEKYDKITGKGVFSCQYKDVDNNVFVTPTFFLTDALFDNGAGYEYVRPIYELTDTAPLSSEIQPGNTDTPITIESKSYYKELKICGLEIVTENGEAIESIHFGKLYDKIGTLLYSEGGITLFAEPDITIIKLGNNIYITFDAEEKNKEGKSVFYKHFYRINRDTNSIETAIAPFSFSVVQEGSNINIEVSNDKGGEINISDLSGQQQAQGRIPAGKNNCRIEKHLNSGNYVISIKDRDRQIHSRKQYIK